MKTKVVLITFLCIIVPLTLASDTQIRFKVCVHVYNEPDTDLDERLEAFLKRELRALGDVDIVGKNSDWDLLYTYNIMEVEYKDGRKTEEIVIASATHHIVPKFLFKSYKFQEPDKPVYFWGLAPTFWYKDDLHEFAIQHVSKRDKNDLEPIRERNRQRSKLLFR